MYEYQATIVRVVDGDTIDVLTDLGFRITFEQRLRLFGINAPELSTPEGKTAKLFLADLLPIGRVVMIRTQKDRQEKYGRYLATVILADGTNLNDLMVSSGHAVVYLP